MNRIKFSRKTIINCTPEEAFDYTQDYTKRLSWDTFLKKADILDGEIAANVGVKTLCVAKNGLGMETEYLTFNRPKVTAVKMTKGPFMFKSFLGSWTFRRYSKNQTEVDFTYSFQIRFPFNVLAKFITNNLKNNVTQRLVDLKLNIERGKNYTNSSIL